MRVIFDATVFCADFRMVGNAFRIFLSSFAHAGLEPCISESVIDEVVNQYRERCEGIHGQAQTVMREYARISGSGRYVFPILSATQLEGFYRTELLGLVVKGFQFLKYPNIAHKELVGRDLRRARPFRESGVGYRDALLWYAVLEELKARPGPTAFVTNNSKDFAENGALHPHLCADLAEMGLPTDVIRLFPTLEALNHALVLPTLQRLAALRDELNAGTLPVQIRAWLTDDLIYYLGEEQGIGPLEPDHGSTRFRSVTAIKSFVVDSIKRLATGETLIAATARITGTVDISADWDDYQNYDDVREFFSSSDGDDEPFSSVSADLQIDATVAFSLIVEAESMTVVSGELDWYETDWGRTEINPHPEDDLPV